MRRRTIIVLMTAASVVGGSAYVLVAKVTRCDEIVELPLRSPDGAFAATATFRACPVGLLSTTTCSVSVALSSGSAPSSNEGTSIFESVDASEVPTLTWVSEHELRVRVNDIGNIQASKHEARGVRIGYTVPKWIWDRVGTFEAEHLRSERESKELYSSGKLSKDDLRATTATEDAMAEEHEKFRRWVMENATEDAQSD
jgi:hypothetical protein